MVAITSQKSQIALVFQCLPKSPFVSPRERHSAILPVRPRDVARSQVARRSVAADEVIE